MSEQIKREMGEFKELPGSVLHPIQESFAKLLGPGATVPGREMAPEEQSS